MAGTPGRQGRIARATGLLLAGLALAALVLGGTQAAGARKAAAFDAAQLGADYYALGGHSLLALSLNLQGQGIVNGDPPPVAAAVEIDVPTGFQLNLAKPVGATVGELNAGVESATDGSGFSFTDSTIVVGDPATYAADPIAQACAPGTHTAVWSASFSLVGPSITVPIAVDAVTAAGAPAAYTIRFCPFRVPSAVLPGGATFAFISAVLLDEVTSPAAPGVYSWNALVTPANQFVGDPTKTFELRALVPLPQTFTLDAQYVPKTHAGVLTGKITSAGIPKVGALVSLSATDQNDHRVDLGQVRTDAAGMFRLRRSFDRTSAVEASVDATVGPCTAPSTAPGGCLRETVSSPGGASATVIVPRKTDARLAIVPRDQALARRSTLAATDLPADWQDAAGATGPCATFTPNLRLLTASGQAFSHIFSSADLSAFALSTASVYTDRKSATTAFGRVAQSAAARCEAADVASPDKYATTVIPLPLARVGDASRAYRATVAVPQGVVNIDLVFVRVGRVVMELDVYSLGLAEDGLDIDLARKLAARARSQKP